MNVEGIQKLEIKMNSNHTSNNPALDIHVAKARFEEERAKRLRPDAASQYVNVSGEMEKDPWREVEARNPVKDHVTFTFVGGGFAGLLTGAELAKKGIDDVRIVDRAGDFGGVWYWNRYPGLMCDSPALIYLPLLEETGHMPTEHFVHQPEILEHCQRLGRHYNLYDKALFHTAITKVRWDEKNQVWHVSTDRGDEFTTKYLGIGTGFLTNPKLPGIPGVEKFKGKSFHAARWDYDYTGGSPENETLDKLADKKVAIIGTGATAIQAVAPLSRSAKELYVFQRTPSALHPRNNRPMDVDYFKSISNEPNWQQKFNDDIALAYAGTLGQPYRLGPVNRLFEGDPFVAIFDGVYKAINSVPPEKRNKENIMAALEALDVRSVAHTHEHTANIVKDPETAEKLKPWYRPACKRPTFNDDYLPSFNRPNTHLVDTDGKGVSEITENGLVANGETYEVDCIIFASGYEFAKDSSKSIQFEIEGEGGKTLQEYWQDGIRTLHGMHVNGFPNLFMVQLAQGADFAPNVPTGWGNTAETIAYIIDHMQQNQLAQVEADKAHEQAWVDLVSNADPVPDLRDCTPGLLSHEGAVDGKLSKLQGYPDGPRAFFKLIETWKAEGEFEGLEFQ
jgi:cyclohexanone monooxygenase